MYVRVKLRLATPLVCKLNIFFRSHKREIEQLDGKDYFFLTSDLKQL